MDCFFFFGGGGGGRGGQPCGPGILHDSDEVAMRANRAQTKMILEEAVKTEKREKQHQGNGCNFPGLFFFGIFQNYFTNVYHILKNK